MIPRPLGGRMAKTAMGARGGVWGIIFNLMWGINFNLMGIHSHHDVMRGGEHHKELKFAKG